VTDSPPTLLVCLNRTSDSNLALKENRILCVNTLAAHQQDLSPVFAGMTEGDYNTRFATATWGTLVTGAPVLQEALISFDCRVSEWTEVGTHSVFFCEVEAICGVEGGAGLIYFGRNYHRVQIG
jgi:flavin reductase